MGEREGDVIKHRGNFKADESTARAALRAFATRGVVAFTIGNYDGPEDGIPFDFESARHLDALGWAKLTSGVHSFYVTLTDQGSKELAQLGAVA